VEAKPSKLKNRTDWLFTFSVRTEPPLKEGETRAAVSVAGNEVNASYRFVFIPEEWQRAERDRRTLPDMINIACIALIALSVVGGIIFGIVSWVRHGFSLRTFLVVAPLLLLVNLAARFNQWPTLTAAFSTAQPYELQVIVMVVSLLIGLTALALGIAVLGGYVTRVPREPQLGPAGRLTAGVSVACLIAGIGAYAARLAPSFEPAWASYAPLAAYVPWVVPPLDAVSQVVTTSLIGWFFVGLVDNLTAGWTRRKGLAVAFMLLLGLAVAGLAGVESLQWWATSGVLVGAFGLAAYVVVFRSAPEVLPISIAAIHTLGAVKVAWSGAYPGVALSSGLRVAMLFAAAWLLLYLWKPRVARDPSQTA
jgi:vacuolar-type H+-ATPase subunit I/STV1